MALRADPVTLVKRKRRKRRQSQILSVQVNPHKGQMLALTRGRVCLLGRVKKKARVMIVT
jgi:hypothetical protein